MLREQAGRMTQRRFFALSSLLALALPAACATDAPDTDLADETSADDDQAASVLTWVQEPNACATSIDVAPDNTIWVVGCDIDANGNGSVWTMRREVSCVDGFCSENPEWDGSSGRGKRVTVDNGGEPNVITAAGERWGGTVRIPRTGPNRGKYIPTLEFEQNLNSKFLCLRDFRFQHVDSYHTYLSTAGVPRADDHWAFGVDCSGKLIYQLVGGGADVNWYTVEISPTSFALFSPDTIAAGAAQHKTIFTLEANGRILKHGDGHLLNGRFDQLFTTPSGTALQLTDGHALTTKGVYKWNGQGWAKVIGLTTQVGSTVTQIAYAGPSSAGAGPSQLWAIDAEGRVFHTAFISTPR